jgi:hypothetical protein
MALKAFSHICAFRTLATSSDRAGFCPYSTGAATAPASGLSLRPGGSDQACRSHRRGGSRAHTRQRVVRPSETVARASLVAPASPLHPPARGCVGCEHRERLLRRDAVPRVDVPQCWWSSGWSCGSGFAAGAAVPGVASVASVGAVVVAVGDRSCVRLEVTA